MCGGVRGIETSRREGRGGKTRGGKGRRVHARSYKQARHVLTAQGCDPEDAFDQRRHAQQHRLLSIPKKTSNICTKT